MNVHRVTLILYLVMDVRVVTVIQLAASIILVTDSVVNVIVNRVLLGMLYFIFL